MSRHLVHFYDDAYPAEEASDFIAAGLLAGDTCIVMLTPANMQAVEKSMAAHRMFATATNADSPTYLSMCTDDVLSDLMVDGRLDKERAAQALAALLNPASHSGGGPVRLVGDPAPALLAAGNEEDALALEGLVGTLSAAHASMVFCAYCMNDLHSKGNTHSLFKLCAEHSAVEFPKRPWIHGFMQGAEVVGDKQP